MGGGSNKRGVLARGKHWLLLLRAWPRARPVLHRPDRLPLAHSTHHGLPTALVPTDCPPPLLLLPVLQGLAMGGEFGPAVSAWVWFFMASGLSLLPVMLPACSRAAAAIHALLL